MVDELIDRELSRRGFMDQICTSTTTTSVVVTATSRTDYVTVTTVTVPAMEAPPAPSPEPERSANTTLADSLLSVPMQRNKSVSVDIATAAQADRDAPPTPNTMVSVPFKERYTPMMIAGAAADEHLSSFLEQGGCLTEGWDADALSQLGSELVKGEATLGYGPDGIAKRVVSVAKPVRVPHISKGLYCSCWENRGETYI